ncbi:ABATE domain-containing protein [Streptomyces sp. NPDC003077]|uniref:CGNR zinc finger domain-containing protein n=1 Tax=Streptomyces sp. NPDC003077 TaxID=3154443 RepID=UPI0033AAE27F
MAVDDDWVWYGGRVCLDFVNTLRDRWKEPRETLHEPDDVPRWLHDAGLLTDSACTVGTRTEEARTKEARAEGTRTKGTRTKGTRTKETRTYGTPEFVLRAAVSLREAIDRSVLTVANGEPPRPVDIAVINAASATVSHPAPQLALIDGRLSPIRAVHTPTDPTAGLALLAQDAIELLLSAEIRRVRVCGSDRCALRFVDRSPARNRRWCSMTRCGNRTKVRLHQARSRAVGPSSGQPNAGEK